MGEIKEWKEIPRKARPKVRYWLPAAAVDDEDLRRELEGLAERGFGGVEVSSRMLFPFMLKSEDGWGGQNWDHVMEVIAKTTERLGMSMDVTNGPTWPISMPTVEQVDDPGASWELTYGCVACPASGSYEGKLPERRGRHEEGTPRLVAVMAYLEKEEKVLDKDSYLDLSRHVTGEGEEERLSCELPPAPEGSRWLIFAFYLQPTAEKTNAGMYYVIDHFSEAGVKACERYWTPIMEKYHNFPSMESFFCDSLEYHTCLEWTPDFLEEFKTRRGYDVLPYLPFLGGEGYFSGSDLPGYRLKEREVSEMINRDYLETLTRCFCENHLAGLERMAEKYGKTVRWEGRPWTRRKRWRSPIWEGRSGIPLNVRRNMPMRTGRITRICSGG